MPLRIFRFRNQIGVYGMRLLIAAAFFGMFLFVTLFLQTVWGYSAMKVGAPTSRSSERSSSSPVSTHSWFSGSARGSG
jgi:hypothetical protein